MIVRKDWKISYVDMYGDEITYIILRNMPKDEAEIMGAAHTPKDRAIEDCTVTELSE